MRVAQSAIGSAGLRDEARNGLGGVSAILVGISYVALGLLVVFQLPELRTGVLAGNTGRYLQLVAQRPADIILENVVYAAGAVLALAAVPAVADRVRAGNEDWVRWASTLAT